ncbi:MAG: NADAR family protein [Candidatus Competibacteraceae bacterium]|nr:NADAR family protein [Candidatus Competibacteraceae bacterium]
MRRLPLALCIHKFKGLSLIFRTTEELQEYVNKGNNVEYVFFWGHQSKGSAIDKSCFSQWYESSFSENGIEYMTAEHYMMAEKARLFGDEIIYKKIISASNPGEAKALGREVKGFEERRWIEHRFNIVVTGNVLKFKQNEALGDFLLNTDGRVLVEASPVDKIWGVGLGEGNRKIKNPNLWRGQNLLGFALMEVRDVLQESHP